MDIWERITFARDQALEAEKTERQRLAEADTAELQRSASVRLATRQAVREALDDVLDEHSELPKGNAIAQGGAQPVASAEPESSADPDPDPDADAEAAGRAAVGDSTQNEGGDHVLDEIDGDVAGSPEDQISG